MIHCISTGVIHGPVEAAAYVVSSGKLKHGLSALHCCNVLVVGHTCIWLCAVDMNKSEVQPSPTPSSYDDDDVLLLRSTKWTRTSMNLHR